MTKKQFNGFIENFDFIHLFNQLGWDVINQTTPVKVNAEIFSLQSVAGKSGFRILICSPDGLGNIPEYTTRLKVESIVSKLFKEHLLIFVNAAKSQQVWQTNLKRPHQPLKLSSVYWYKGQVPELLYQKAAGLIFTLDEEENITIVDVVERVATNFSQNNERVTKQFYDKFKKEHTSFLAFIKGIDDKLNKDWYASLMLNRLMFCYFIQKKGFLDNKPDYLRRKLKECQEKKGLNQFYSFYRDFLLLLFHKGLGAPEHSKDVLNEIGNIPYLNGGLFDEHELEVNYKDIDIDDKAFERIFDFFDEWNWHLDTRATATGKDINPDVIGYIFEKYINDRADMGAYYTKEDITEYISKNCILPYLFDETKRNYPQAFDVGGWLWEIVKLSGDKYIYPAVKKGVGLPLPNDIARGVDNVGARTEWNKPASDEFALPTEIWREVVDRRSRCTKVKSKIENGEINQINDFITYNLDIRQLAQDIIENCADTDFLKHFYKALNSITILDPTCGSGAFLFAALNILEPLYESCLTRMRNFTGDEDRLNQKDKHNFGNKYKFFRQVLEETQNDQHPNLQYYIYKSIILRNLYGVDIMKEAVEIAKLRLFLKLVATVDVDHKKPNMGLEPLPDIDFNIRYGNSLIGFSTESDLNKGLDYTFDGLTAKPAITENCDLVAKAFAHYKKIQLTYGDNYKEFKKAKEELFSRLKNLNFELNQLLYKQDATKPFKDWLVKYQPFHWFAEFYEIISGKGGFNVIIGNPPYVEYKDIKATYIIKDYVSLEASDLYAFVMERAIKISHTQSRVGFIIPMSCFTVDSFSTIQNLYYKCSKYLYVSNWSGDAHPSKLFEGVDKRLNIVLSVRNDLKGQTDSEIFVTKYIKWYSEERPYLFESKVNYYSINRRELPFFKTSLPKISTEIENDIIKKLKNGKPIMKVQSINSSSHSFYYTRKVSFFLQILNFVPVVKDNNGILREPSELKSLSFFSEHDKYVSLASLSSNTFYWYYIINSDCRNLNKREVVSFNIPHVEETYYSRFQNSVDELMSDYIKNSTLRTVYYRDKGNITVQYFNVRSSKKIIDKIDSLLSDFYMFSDAELDFLINYEIKYRLGKGHENDENE